jgi:hypothetical protein
MMDGREDAAVTGVLRACVHLGSFLLRQGRALASPIGSV